jgi:predicted RNA-binding Zn ribbon-like protein
MPSVPTPSQAADALADFRYVGGDVSVDFVNSAVWVDGRVLRERLTDYPSLAQWAEGAGVVDGATAGALRRLAVRRPRDAMSAVRSAVRLRDVLRRVFVATLVWRGGATTAGRGRATVSSLAASEPIDGLLRTLNGELRLAMAHLALHRAGGGIRLGWDAMAKDLDSLLRPVVHSAALLVSSLDAERLRECAGPSCGWMYVDRSRNGLRRWCEMETCGARAKARRHYARSRAGQPGSV